MKKKGITLAVGVVFMCGLFGAYFLLKSHNEKAEETASTESDTETILEINTDEISSLSFAAGEETLEFTCTDGEWQLNSDEAFPVNSTSLTSILSCMAPLEAVRTLTDITDASEYGMEEPQNTITFSDSDGNETVVTIGSTNATTGDDYVMLNNDTTTIYTTDTSLLSSISDDLYDYALSEDIPSIQAADIVGASVSAVSDSYEISLSDGSWIVADADGDPLEADQDEINSAFSTLASALYYSDFLEYNCTDSSAYGLDEPSAVFTVTYTEKTEEETEEAESDTESDTEALTEEGSETDSGSETETETEVIENTTLTFYIGNTDESGNYYVQMEGSTQVHTIAASTLSPFLDASAADWEAPETEAETETETTTDADSNAEAESADETESENETEEK